MADHGGLFGDKVSLPPGDASFDFAIPENGGLPLDGAVPSIIDRCGKARAMTMIADLGARLRSFSLEHPEPATLSALYRQLDVDRPPIIVKGILPRYRARVETPSGTRDLA